MNPFRSWTRPVAMLEQAAGLAVLGGLWYKWLGIAESSVSQLLLSVSTVFGMLAITLMLVARGRTRIAGPTGPTLVALLLFAMSLAAAYYLVWWVPSVAGLRSQTISVALRFGVAFLLVVTFWANFLGSLARSGAPNTQPENQAA